MLAASRRSITSLTSARKRCANVFVLVTFSVLDSAACGKGTLLFPLGHPESRSHRNARALQTPPVACAAADRCRPRQGRKACRRVTLQTLPHEKPRVRNRCSACEDCGSFCCKQKSFPPQSR